MDTKLCTQCDQTKPVSEFYSKKRVTRQGEVYRQPDSACKSCQIYRTGNRQRTLRETDPEKAKKYNWAYSIMRRHGMTVQDFMEMWDKQEGKCLTCEREMTIEGYNIATRAHIDHCHITNKVRGLLCASCNKALGLIYDNPQTLFAMITYLDPDFFVVR